jgi:hypothetical protein
MYTDDVESKASAHGHEFVPENPASDGALKLDPHGYPLRPQPSDDPLG